METLIFQGFASFPASPILGVGGAIAGRLIMSELWATAERCT
ncbi:MAG: hypothetical protein ACOCXU_05430 [Coleofasciculus sp.]